MKYFKALLGLLLIFIISIPVRGQKNWTLQKEKDGIRISLRQAEKSAFNDIRVELDVPGNPEQLAAIIMDVKKYVQWLYSTKKTVLIEQLGKNKLIYLTEIFIPWPIVDRFYYSNLELIQDSANHSFRVVTSSIPGYKPIPEGLVVIPYTKGTWNVTRLSEKSIHIDFVLELDPGRFMPSWVFNMFITKGPLETFTNIKRKMMDLNNL